MTVFQGMTVFLQSILVFNLLSSITYRRVKNKWCTQYITNTLMMHEVLIESIVPVVWHKTSVK